MKIVSLCTVPSKLLTSEYDYTTNTTHTRYIQSTKLYVYTLFNRMIFTLFKQEYICYCFFLFFRERKNLNGRTIFLNSSIKRRRNE